MTYEDAMRALEYAHKNDTELGNDTLISMLNVADCAVYGDEDGARNAGVQIKRLVREIQRLQQWDKPVRGLGYQMALDDIGEIGKALGLNPGLYMIQSPIQVAKMILRRAKELVAQLHAVQEERDRARTISQQLVKSITDALKELASDPTPSGIEETIAQKVQHVVAERDQWQRRAEAQLEITQAAIAIVAKPYQLYESRGYTGAYLVNKKEFEDLQRAVEDYQKLAEQEAAASSTPTE